jgi:hypothetical protein
MKSKALLKPVAALLFAVFSSNAQTFQNLNFEQANPVAVGGSSFEVTASSAFPSWTVEIGGAVQSEVLFNAVSSGSTEISLVSSSYSFAPALDGNFSVVLEAGGDPSLLPSISQTAQIPATTQSLLFKAEQLNIGNGPLDVQIGNQIVPTFAVGTGPNYTIFGANLSAWAGQVEQVSFTAPVGNGLNDWEIDDISFSPTAVTPEPTPLVLTGISGILFALHRRFLRR